MTTQEARSEGLQFTGYSYSESERDDAKAKAKAIRDQGFRAVVVRVKSSDRWGTTYYRVYASPEYEASLRLWENYVLAPRAIENLTRKIEELRAEIASLEAEKAEAQALLDGPKPKAVL